MRAHRLATIGPPYLVQRSLWLCRGSLAGSPWLLAAHSFVYRTSRSSAKAQQLEKELRGLVDECALCAGSLQLFLESVAATVQRHNKAAYTHTGEASAVVLKRDQAKLRMDLAAAILELRHCFPVSCAPLQPTAFFLTSFF